MYSRTKRERCLTLCFWAICVGLFPASAWSRQQLNYRGIAVNLIKPDPEFLVHVDVDRDDRKYQLNEKVQVVVRSEVAGYLYLFYLDANDDCLCIFPNASGTDCLIEAKKDTNVPNLENPAFEFVITPPFGKEILKAIVTERPLETLSIPVLQKSPATAVPLTQIPAGGTGARKPPQFRWGEVDLRVTTVARRPGVSDAPVATTATPAKPPVNRTEPREPLAKPDPPATDTRRRRWGLFVGLSRFADEKLSLPTSARNNAEMTAAAMQLTCGLTSRPIRLLDEEATLQAVQNALTKELGERCDSGDDVFIYWSGRSGWLQDTNGDEGADGRDEYLLPFDGDPNDPGSLIIDDTFARWVQKLDRCNVTVILDTYAHDASKQEDAETNGEFDFLSTEVIRAKSLGETNVVLLSRTVGNRDEFADGQATLSRMTSVYLNALQEGEGPFTLFDAFQTLRDQRIPTTLNDPELARKIRLRD